MSTPTTTGDLTPETAVEKSAFDKIARRLLPLALIAFLITYVDRVNIGVAANGIENSLGVTAGAFGLAAGLFYVGYLLGEIPSNILLERFGARRWIARILITFGIISGATAFVWDEGSLITVRILLGLAEAGMYPGLLLYLGYWFSHRRRASNWLLFQLSLPLGLAFGSLISSSLLNLDGVFGIEGWRWIFLVEGALTIAYGIVFYLAIPDKPKDARWLTPAEQAAVEAVTEAGKTRDIHGWLATRKVIASPVSWYLILMFFSTLVGFLSVNYFAPTLIRERFEVGPVAAGFMSVIPWTVSALSLIVAALIVRRFAYPAVIIFVAMCICAVGITMAAIADNPVIAFIGLCMATVQQAAVPMVFVFVRAYFPLAFAAVGFAFVNAVANLAGLVGPVMLGRVIEVTGSSTGGLLVLSGFFWLAAVMGISAPKFLKWNTSRNPGYFGDSQSDATASNANANANANGKS